MQPVCESFDRIYEQVVIDFEAISNLLMFQAAFFYLQSSKQVTEIFVLNTDNDL
jgi:hypothetical protein